MYVKNQATCIPEKTQHVSVHAQKKACKSYSHTKNARQLLIKTFNKL